MSGRRFSIEGRSSTVQLRVEQMPVIGRITRRANQLPKAKVPTGFGWRGFGHRIDPEMRSAIYAWVHLPTNTQVLSSLVRAELPRSGVPGPQWHISIVDRSTEEPLRPNEGQVALARCAFDMLSAEEDNHHPGNARHFWMPVDPLERVDCECKETEQIIEDADGYRWTNPTDGPCRGCENEEVMRRAGILRPCPIHHALKDGAP